jgi:hypothetical protein
MPLIPVALSLEQPRRQLPPLVHLVHVEVRRERADAGLYRRRSGPPVLNRVH